MPQHRRFPESDNQPTQPHDNIVTLWSYCLAQGILGAFRGDVHDLDWVAEGESARVGSLSWICDHIGIEYDALITRVKEGLAGDRPVAPPNSPNITRAILDRHNDRSGYGQVQYRANHDPSSSLVNARSKRKEGYKLIRLKKLREVRYARKTKKTT